MSPNCSFMAIIGFRYDNKPANYTVYRCYSDNKWHLCDYFEQNESLQALIEGVDEDQSGQFWVDFEHSKEKWVHMICFANIFAILGLQSPFYQRIPIMKKQNSVLIEFMIFGLALVLSWQGTLIAQITPPHKGPPNDLMTAKILFLLSDSLTLADYPPDLKGKPTPNIWNFNISTSNQGVRNQAPKYPFPYMIDYERNLAFAQEQGCKYVFRYAPAKPFYKMAFRDVRGGSNTPEAPLLIVNIETGEEWRVGELPEYFAQSGGPTLKYFIKKVCHHFEVDMLDK